LLAPSRDALQEMLKTCETYAEEHNLKFSTDPDPNKCKTKCIAFLKNGREIVPLQLCWVYTGLIMRSILGYTSKIKWME
jgi:hypothetical protein